MAQKVSHETLREWWINFSALFAQELRHQEARPCSRWHLIEVWTSVNDIRYGFWRAVDERGFVLDILLQRHRDPEAAKTFLLRLLGEYDVPEVMYTDQLQSGNSGTSQPEGRRPTTGDQGGTLQ
ncbi:DDE-type integrase/transposase/recombinase [Deinococcus oregonensis]|uniref:DDE-type integrase/transposase/recombinase n=1 Tax=Deinococcus oregonensis TaxID=1805970 RepID=A0ABV6ASI0_9DEIO